MSRFVYSFILLMGLTFFCDAQELNCQVQINSDQIQSSDKRIFETLQKAIFEYMNNTKWTTENFTNEERIGMSMYITIQSRPSSDEFSASLQIQSFRPVLNTSYKSAVFNFNDPNFGFKYLEYQPLEFSLNNFTDNLTSVLAYYAYLVIGLDYDTFSLKGGDKYLQAAQTIVNNAASSNYAGWKAFDGNRNRYWIMENLLNPAFIPFRTCLYEYHRKGMDMMEKDLNIARSQITMALEKLEQVHKKKPNSFMMQLFFFAKSDEIVNIYSDAFPDVKGKMIELLSKLDPSNISKYQKITKG